jgi:cytochrome c
MSIKAVVRLIASMLALAPGFAQAADAELGEYLSAECVTCHQLSGDSAGGIPPIVGLPEDLFVEAVLAYKTGERSNEVMHNIAARLSTEEIAALAAYFAAHKPKH